MQIFHICCVNKIPPDTGAEMRNSPFLFVLSCFFFFFKIISSIIYNFCMIWHFCPVFPFPFLLLFIILLFLFSVFLFSPSISVPFLCHPAGTQAGEEIPIVSRSNIKEFKESFSNENFDFRNSPNITFFVYVSNFTWPIKIQVSNSYA